MSNISTEIEQEKKYFSIFTGYALKERKNLLLTIFMLLLNTIIVILAPIFFQRALEVLEQIETVGEDADLLFSIVTALVFYFILTVLSWFSRASIAIFSTRLNGGIIRRLRKDTFDSLLENDMSFFDQSESGDVVSILTNDLNELYETGNAIAEVITASLRLIGILVLLLYYSVVLTLSSLILLPLFFIVTLIIRKYRRQSERDWRQNFGQVNQSFAEILRSIEISKAFNREEENVEKFTELNEKTYQASIKRGAAIFISRPVADFLRNILLITILAVGANQVQNAGLSVANFYLFIFLLDFYYEPVRAIARNYNRFQSLFANLERVISIAHFGGTHQEKSGEKSLDSFSGHTELIDVFFAYEGNDYVLKEINFEVKPGQRVALVGHTGSGKTTIAHLLMKFYNIDSGEILLDGLPINEYDINSLRQNIGLVSQDVLLFKGTILENLKFASPDISEEDIWEAIDAVQMREYIDMLPDGLYTQIDEDGKNLSAGQRQMLSFARTLLSKPKLILLDEATSSVDLYTEAKIQQATDLLLENTTSLVIAHRLTTIIRSDKIVVLEQGKIRQIGTHQELLEQGGLYKEMYDLYFQTQSAEYLEVIKKKG